MSFLRRLLGLEKPDQPKRAVSAPAKKTPSSDATFARSARSRIATTRYFELMGPLQGAISAGSYDEAARIVGETLDVVERWLQEDVGEYGRFLVSSIPVFEKGGRVLAYLGRDRELARMLTIVERHAEFAPWQEMVAEHRADQVRFARILEIVARQPGTLQTDMKDLLGEDHGGHVATLIAFLEKAGRINRQRSGKSYKLLPAGTRMDAEGVLTARIGLPQAPASSHRRGKTAPKPRLVNFADIERIPLPRSPIRWEIDQDAAQTVKPAKDPFEVRDANWRLVHVEKLPRAARPDPAFRRFYPLFAGTLLVDDLGKSEAFPDAPAALQRYGADGELKEAVALSRRIYRFSAHPLGDGFVSSSDDAVLQIYGSDLKLRLETSLALAPEIQAIKARLTLSDEQLRTHIRCVALSPEGSRYLVTVVDEAWCVTLNGDVAWGIKMPIKEGFQPSDPGQRQAETSSDVNKALETLGLSLPVSPEDIKRRYRELTKQYHPDLNGGDRRAVEKMQAINAALQAVTGLTAEAAPAFTGVRYAKELHRSSVQTPLGTMTISMQMVVSESFAADWIYAAAFGSDAESAYLATYSGRVVLIDSNGVPKRSYEIGAVPKAIIDTGSFLYVQTDTRLYVIRGAKLYRLLDIYAGGDLIVSKDGFGLMEKKRFRWFSPEGVHLGSVVTKDPLRRAFWKDGNLVLETRQARAQIATN